MFPFPIATRKYRVKKKRKYRVGTIFFMVAIVFGKEWQKYLVVSALSI